MLLKKSNNGLTIYSFDNHYKPLVEKKDVTALIVKLTINDFLINQWKNKKCMKIY